MVSAAPAGPRDLPEELVRLSPCTVLWGATRPPLSHAARMSLGLPTPRPAPALPSDGNAAGLRVDPPHESFPALICGRLITKTRSLIKIGWVVRISFKGNHRNSICDSLPSQAHQPACVLVASGARGAPRSPPAQLEMSSSDLDLGVKPTLRSVNSG